MSSYSCGNCGNEHEPNVCPGPPAHSSQAGRQTMSDPNLAAMREVERVTLERAAQAVKEQSNACGRHRGPCHTADLASVHGVAPLTDAELTEIWERSQKYSRTI